ncbi:uncharacterized protein LOC114849101 isoform X1 [Betta splendens]|uniref:Uncharacterized protein LOC114849101 isoform X1 n=1 Tax=Betta splendens TaxID=158456 RepID=A0A6P7LQ84_BETSP|nr:uncharacterized protein LOC114849101 isoform X1 [Betta splendens]
MSCRGTNLSPSERLTGAGTSRSPRRRRRGWRLEMETLKRVFSRRTLRRGSSILSTSDNVQDEPKPEEALPLQLNHMPEKEPAQKEQEEQEEQETVPCRNLSELLQMRPGSDVNTSVDGVPCLECTDSNSEQQNQNQGGNCLVQLYVSQQFPEPPENQNLHQHLQNIQTTVLNELTGLSPVLDERLMGHLINCYHRQTFNQMHRLLQNISSTQNHFVLMMWVLKTYLSQELLGHPDLQKVDPIKNIDLLLFTEWEAKARDKLLQSVHEEVSDSLENILLNEKTHEQCNSEEDYVRVFVDTIQCIKAVHKAAQQISSKLSDDVQNVCFQQLLVFVKRYSDEQTEGLGKKAAMPEPETIQFLKTLKTCKELKLHVQVEAAGASYSGKIVETLDKLEVFTLNLLLDIVDKMAEANLSTYFKSDSKCFSLLPAVQKRFPKQCYGADEQKRVLNKAYKLIVQIYVKHLIKTNKRQLESCWNPDVSKTIGEDAHGIHSIMSELAPDVPQQNQLLLKVKELLDCECNEALKLTAATIQKDFGKDPELLPALLKWKGLPKGQVREVLETIQHDYHHQSGCSPIKCW